MGRGRKGYRVRIPTEIDLSNDEKFDANEFARQHRLSMVDFWSNGTQTTIKKQKQNNTATQTNNNSRTRIQHTKNEKDNFAKLSKDQKKTLRDIQRKLESGGFSQSDFNTQIRSIAKSLGIDTNDRSLMSVAKDVESALGISL